MKIRAAAGRSQVTSAAGDGADGFDRHEHDALAQRGMDEPMALVKPGCGRVDRVGDDAAHARDFGGGEATPERDVRASVLQLVARRSRGRSAPTAPPPSASRTTSPMTQSRKAMTF